MFRRRSIMGIAGLIVAAMLVIAGCGKPAQQQPAPQPQQPAPTTPTPAPKAEPSLSDPASINAEITVWGWAPWDVSFAALMPDFNKKFPNIKVKVEMMGYQDNHDKLIASLAAGSGAPDVVGIEIAYIDKLAMQGGLVNLLDPPYNAGKYKNDFIGYKWTQATSPDGRLIAMPWDVGPGVMFYRRDVFEKAGLPSDPDRVGQLLATWDGYIEAGQKIKAATGSFMVSNPMDIFTIWFNHKDMFDKDWNVIVDGPKGQQYLNTAKKIRQAGIDARIGTWSGEWVTALAEGKIATLYGGSWMGGLLKTWIHTDGAGKWGAVMTPGDPGVNWGGSFLAIPEQSKNKLAAWAFVEFSLATAVGQNHIMRSTDIFPAYIPSFSDPLYDEPDPYFGGQKTRRLFIDIANKIPPLVTTPMDTIAEPKLNEIVGQCIEQNTDTVKCLQDAKKAIESAISKDKQIALKLKELGKK